MHNPFELFGLTIDSSIEELKKSYYNLSLLSDALENALIDQIENLNNQIKNLTASNKELLIEKNKAKTLLNKMKTTLSNLM